MSIRKHVAWLERQAEKDKESIRELEAELKAKTMIPYGEEYYGGMWSSIRAEVPIVDVINSILRYLHLEIKGKTPSTTTEATVELQSTKKINSEDMNKYLRCKSCGHEEKFTFDTNLFGPEIKLPRCQKCKKNDWEHSEDVKRKWEILDNS